MGSSFSFGGTIAQATGTELAAFIAAAPANAYTQTYSTADRTIANPTAATMTDSSGGTSGTLTIAAITGAVDPTAATIASTANAIATLAAMVNKLTADTLAMKKNDTAMVDDGQTVGIWT